MLPFGLAGCAIAANVLAGRIPSGFRNLAISILFLSVAAGVGAIWFWISDGLLGSVRRCGEFGRWLLSGRAPVCWSCGGAGRLPIRSTAGLVADYSTLMLICAPAMWFLMERIDQVLR